MTRNKNKSGKSSRWDSRSPSESKTSRSKSSKDKSSAAGRASPQGHRGDRHNNQHRPSEPRSNNGDQNPWQYMPYPPYYYPPPYLQSKYAPPSLWPPFYHSNFAAGIHGSNSNSNVGFQNYYGIPPMPPPFGMFRNTPHEINQRDGNRQDPTHKNQEAEEPPPLGSEAAREKERAAIAERLKQFDKKPCGEVAKQSKKPSTPTSPVKSSSTSVKSTSASKKPLTKSKPREEKSLKRPSSNSASEVPNKKSSNSDVNKDIAHRISSMGLVEIKNLVNHPQSVKSQEILKALMDHYRTLKGVELDKRRLLAPTTSSSAPSCNQVLSDVDSIAIADLPQEIITQLENFLGCDLFTPVEFQPSEEIALDQLNSPPLNTHSDTPLVVEEPQLVSDNPSINEMPENENIRDPEQILEELVIIDMRIQAEMHRKMELYRQLHEIMVRSSQSTLENVEPSQPSEQQISSSSGDALPPPMPVMDLPTQFPAESSCSSEISKPSGESSAQNKQPKPSKLHKNAREGAVHDKRQLGVDKAEVKKQSLQKHAAAKTVLKERISIDIRSFRIELYDLKVVDSTTIVAACNNHNIYGFDISSSKKTHEFKGHVDVVTCLLPVKYRREHIEEQIICSGGLDEHICVFGYHSQQCVAKHYVASPVLSLAFYNDLVTNSKLLYAGLKNGMVQTYDVEKFVPRGSLDCGSKAISALLVTKEGPRSILIVGAEDKTVCIRDASTGLYLRQFNYSYVATNFVLHGDSLFCQSVSNGVTYFDIKTGEYLGFLKANSTVSRMVKTENLLIATLFSGSMRVFNMDTKRFVTEISGEGKLFRYIDVADEKIIVAARINDMMVIPFPLEMREALRSR
ncbi:uncharacterized protein LOC132197724 [Neocloeon triangulifer]|uniref:uncharacterized protein LOC132197724 n=1 Tax=Neocloeon triangulifer TaxID=2078957 RepID=UPI00286F7A97|nr:uncharacterized protein LOC132197724 [Neocloeon triangulifer]